MIWNFKDSRHCGIKMPWCSLLYQRISITCVFVLLLRYVRRNPMYLSAIHFTQSVFSVDFAHYPCAAFHAHSAGSVFEVAHRQSIKRTCILFVDVRWAREVVCNCNSVNILCKIRVDFVENLDSYSPNCFIFFKLCLIFKKIITAKFKNSRWWF